MTHLDGFSLVEPVELRLIASATVSFKTNIDICHSAHYKLLLRATMADDHDTAADDGTTDKTIAGPGSLLHAAVEMVFKCHESKRVEVNKVSSTTKTSRNFYFSRSRV